jgi:hypothetical protein
MSVAIYSPTAVRSGKPHFHPATVPQTLTTLTGRILYLHLSSSQTPYSTALAGHRCYYINNKTRKINIVSLAQLGERQTEVTQSLNLEVSCSIHEGDNVPELALRTLRTTFLPFLCPRTEVKRT